MPNDAIKYNELLTKGNAEYNLGNFKVAIEFYERAIAIDCEYESAYIRIRIDFYSYIKTRYSIVKKT